MRKSDGQENTSTYAYKLHLYLSPKYNKYSPIFIYQCIFNYVKLYKIKITGSKSHKQSFRKDLFILLSEKISAQF